MADIRFRRGAAEAEAAAPSFDYDMLSDEEKLSLCRSLLEEFGAGRITEMGTELKHCCVMPWHNDNRPSAQLNWKKLTYKCFSCDSGGGLLWLIATCRESDTQDARNWLRTQVGFDDGAESLQALLNFFDEVYREGKIAVPIPTMSMKALDPYRAVHPYLTEIRGIPEENVIQHDVGYGTFRVQRVKDGAWIDSQRIIVPHIWKGKLVGWQTRRLLADGSPKWQSSGDMPKRSTIYNYDPRHHKEAVVVEAPLSVVAKTHLAHFVATFGTGMPERQMRLLAQYAKVILWMDNDPSGYRAVLGRDEMENRKPIHYPGLGETLEPYSQVWIVDSPYDADPADLDDATVLRLLDEALVPFSVWTPPTELVPYVKEEIPCL